MGCSESVPGDPEEKAIAFAEKGLGFGELEAETIDYAIRKYSSGDEITEVQLSRIRDFLNIPMENHWKHPKISSFYDSLKKNRNVICRQELLMLGLLLGKGSTDEKSQFLFQCFDDQCMREISKEKLREIFKKIVKISLMVCKLVDYDQTPISDELRVNKYLEHLNIVSDEAALQIAGLFDVQGIEFVSESQFCEILTDMKLVSTNAWRKELHKYYVKDPSKRIVNNPYRTSGKEKIEE